jgi:acetyl esterase
MTLPPQVRALLAAGEPAPPGLTVPEQRQRIRRLSDQTYLRFGSAAEPVGSVTDYQVPVVGGQVTVRAYRPAEEMGPLPGHVELHGGGWWLGSIDEHINDAICRYRCVHAGCAVFAVEYRLAPEHPFPVPIEDAYAAVAWIAAHASSLGIGSGGLSIAGSSAGANLAAAVTLKARELGGPRLVFQLLDVPVLDLTGESMREQLTTPELAPVAHQRHEFEAPLLRYLRDPADALAPMASPVLAGDLSGLPPAHVMTAEYDPLRAEGELYARRLAQAGVPATVARQAGAIHGAAYLTGVWEPARERQRDAAQRIRQAHERESIDR